MIFIRKMTLFLKNPIFLHPNKHANQFHHTFTTDYKALVLTFILLFGLQAVSAQNTKIDSLRDALNNLAPDTSKVNTLTNLAFELRFIDSNEAINYARQGLQLADSIAFSKGKAQALRNIAVGHMYGSNSDTAIYFARIAETLAVSIDNKQIQGDALNTIGNSFYLKGNYDSARIAHEKSKLLFEEISNSSGVATALSSIGIIYSEQGKYSKALENYQDALSFYEKENRLNNIANTYNNMANIYLERDEFDKALTYYQKTSVYDSLTGNKSGRAHTLLNIANVLVTLDSIEAAKRNYWSSINLGVSSGSECMTSLPMTQLGDLYLDLEHFDSAYFYISRALSMATECGYERSMASAYLDLGEYYKIMGNLKQAEEQLLKGLAVAKNQNLRPNMGELSSELHKVYELQGNYQLAYKYLKINMEVEEELFNKENTQKITRLEAEYEFDKEKQLIAADQEKKDLQFEQEITKQEWIKYSVIVVASFLAVIAFMSYRSYKRKKDDNFLLEEKNKHLKELRVREQQLSVEALSAKERELATMAMSSHEKNSLLQDLEHKVSFLENRLDDSVKSDLKEMRRTISDSYSLDKSWDSFLHKFEGVHPHFFDKLKEENPNLTINDLKLSAYLKIGMSNKEIANVTHLTLGSVKSSINRLKKKLKMHAEDSIRDFVLKYA